MRFDKSNPIHLVLSFLIVSILFLAGIKAAGSLSKTQLGVGLNATCSLDNLAGATKEAPNRYSISSLTSSVTFQGWIANPASGESPENFQILLSDEKNYIKWSEEFKTDFPRPDVLAVFGAGDQMLTSGYNSAANLVKLDPGTYTILFQGQYSGNTILCTSQNTLVIKD